MASGATGATFDVFFTGPGDIVSGSTGLVETSTSATRTFENTGNSNADLFGYFAGVDITSGELQATIETQGASGRFGTGISAAAFLSETVTVSGEGTVTFTIGFDGFWDVTPQSDLPLLFDVVVDLAIDDGQGLVFDDPLRASANAANNRDDPAMGTTSGELSVSTEVNGTRSFDISASLRTAMGRGNGIVDFSNTATLGFFTTGSATVSFSDPNFLAGGATNPGTPAPVPLPSGLLLLLSGLFGLKQLSKKRVRIGQFMARLGRPTFAH